MTDLPDKTISELYDEGTVDDEYLETAGEKLAEMQRAHAQLADMIELVDALQDDRITLKEYDEGIDRLEEKWCDEEGKAPIDRLF